jgi:hypothetical protein
MPEILDSYERFINTFKIDKEDLYEFGLRETILPPIELVEEYWNDLKNRIFNNGVVAIRGYGRDAKGTGLYLGLYKHLFKNDNVKKDATNNFDPFTGHETKGDWPLEYQERFTKYTRERYSYFIHEYNELIKSVGIVNAITEYIQELEKIDSVTDEIMQFEKDALNELSAI